MDRMDSMQFPRTPVHDEGSIQRVLHTDRSERYSATHSSIHTNPLFDDIS